MEWSNKQILAKSKIVNFGVFLTSYLPAPNLNNLHIRSEYNHYDTTHHN